MKKLLEQSLAIRSALTPLVGMELDFKTSYKIAKLIKSLDDDAKFFEDQMRSILERFAEKDENGSLVYADENKTSVKVTDEKKEECAKCLQELQAIEVEVPDVKFSIEELQGIKMTPFALSAITDILE